MKTLSLITLTQVIAFTSACVSPAAKRSTDHAYSNKTETAQIIEYKSDSSGFDTKNYFYVSKHEVVAIDAQFTPQAARASIDHLRKFTQKPITWLVITHPNPDKFNGASEFIKEGARVIASQATADAMAGVHAYKKYFFVEIAKMFSEETYPELSPVDEVFDTNLKLSLKGGDSLELREFNQAGVSTNQTVVYSEKNSSLFLGDLIHFQAHAWLEGGIVDGSAQPELESWKSLLTLMLKSYPQHTTVFAGRGQSARLEEATREQIHYLSNAENIVRNYIEHLGERRSELKTQEASKHYQSIAQELGSKFPKHKLSYMVEYGVYGLINQILAE